MVVFCWAVFALSCAAWCVFDCASPVVCSFCFVLFFASCCGLADECVLFRCSSGFVLFLCFGIARFCSAVCLLPCFFVGLVWLVLSCCVCLRFCSVCSFVFALLSFLSFELCFASLRGCSAVLFAILLLCLLPRAVVLLLVRALCRCLFVFAARCMFCFLLWCLCLAALFLVRVVVLFAFVCCFEVRVCFGVSSAFISLLVSLVCFCVCCFALPRDVVLLLLVLCAMRFVFRFVVSVVVLLFCL